MTFLTADDFKGIIALSILNQLRGTGDANLESSELTALSELDPLRTRYDIDAELAKATTSRSGILIRILVNLTAYWLYNTTADTDIPERIMENYKTALRDIELFGSGKKSSSLTALTDDEGEVVTRFEYGFDDKRTNNPFH